MTHSADGLFGSLLHAKAATQTLVSFSKMPAYPFYQVDVFSDKATLGNPVAVVLVPKGQNVSQEEMQHFAHWTNLSETTFLFQAEDENVDYHLRIFTPMSELAFAGHPTLGSCRAWFQHGGKSKRASTVVQQCGIGKVEIVIEKDGLLSFAAPPLIRTGEVDNDIVERACAAMQIEKRAVLDAQWIQNGAHWFAIRLASAKEVLRVELGCTDSVNDIVWGIFGPYEEGEEAAYEVRAFAPGQNIKEDPVCGSFNAGLALHLQNQPSRTGDLPPARYTVTQGKKLGRDGRVYVSRDDASNTTWIGGHTTTCISGRVDL